MGTAKRERQKAGRQSRRAEAEAAAAKAKRNRNVRNYAIYGLIVLAIAATIFFLNRGGDDDNNVTTTNVTTTIDLSSATTAPEPFVYGTTECPPATGAEQKRNFNAPFKQCIDPAKTYTATIKTNKGDLTVKLDPTKAPGTVNNFVALAQYKFFDGVPCHRIIPSFVVQCGDPTGTGTGGPGFKFNDELPKAGDYVVGSLAMANSGANTNGSQFFIITGAQGAGLPPQYSLFGEVTEGKDSTLKALDAAGTPEGVPTKEPISIQSVTITVS